MQQIQDELLKARQQAAASEKSAADLQERLAAAEVNNNHAMMQVAAFEITVQELKHSLEVEKSANQQRAQEELQASQQEAAVSAESVAYLQRSLEEAEVAQNQALKEQADAQCRSQALEAEMQELQASLQAEKAGDAQRIQDELLKTQHQAEVELQKCLNAQKFRTEEAQAENKMLEKFLRREREGTRRLQKQLQLKAPEKSWLRFCLGHLMWPLVLLALQNVGPVALQTLSGTPSASEVPLMHTPVVPAAATEPEAPVAGLSSAIAVSAVPSNGTNTSKAQSSEQFVDKQPVDEVNESTARPQEQPLVPVRRSKRNRSKELVDPRSESSSQLAAIKEVWGLPTFTALASIFLGYASKR